MIDLYGLTPLVPVVSSPNVSTKQKLNTKLNFYPNDLKGNIQSKTFWRSKKLINIMTYCN